jgi:hypothetical protein
VAIYNQAAKHFGFSICQRGTAARLRRLDKRLDDIGGLENFRIALRSLGKRSDLTDWLLGRVPARDGKEPFKLDIDRLLRTDGNMGDVLARLLDKAGDGEDQKIGPNGKPWGWWRQNEQAIRDLSADDWRRALAKQPPNGEWPWWLYGPPPGHPECLMHLDVLAEYGFIEQYNANGEKKS